MILLFKEILPVTNDVVEGVRKNLRTPLFAAGYKMEYICKILLNQVLIYRKMS